MCSFCSQYPGSIEHFFSECEIVSQLSDNLKNWIINKLRINIIISKSMKILGYLVHDVHFWPLNFVLMIARSYIFQSCRKNCALNIFALQLQVKMKYLEQQMLQKSVRRNIFLTEDGIYGTNYLMVSSPNISNDLYLIV